MKTFEYKCISNPNICSIVTAETASKAKYKIWLYHGASDSYNSFKEFLSDISLRTVNI